MIPKWYAIIHALGNACFREFLVKHSYAHVFCQRPSNVLHLHVHSCALMNHLNVGVLMQLSIKSHLPRKIHVHIPKDPKS